MQITYPNPTKWTVDFYNVRFDPTHTLTFLLPAGGTNFDALAQIHPYTHTHVGHWILRGVDTHTNQELNI